MRATFPGVRAVSNRFGLPKFLLREGGALSAPSVLQPEDNAREFLRAHPSLFPLSPTEVAGLRVLLNDAGPSATFITFGQTVGGVDVFNGYIRLVMTKAGEVVAVSAADIVPGLSLSTRPRIDAARGAMAALRACGGKRTSTLTRLARPDGKIAFHNPNGTRYSPVTTELVVFPVDAESARLAYRVFSEMDHNNWYEVLIDASDASLLFRHNLRTSVVGQGSVWLQSPMVGTRPLVSFPEAWLPKSPNSRDKTGWVTTGNNVDAYLSTYGDFPDDSNRAATLSDGRAYAANAVFDFLYGDGLIYRDPRDFASAAVTNLFYFVNIAHDYFYGLGFTETAANFQTLKFGKSARGNDAVIAEAQQGLEVDNSSFAPTPEGTAPYMRIGLMTRRTQELTDDLDPDYDGQTVIHEYTHGMSNRLVGAGVSTSCLTGIQSGAMGEGWSDYFAISYFNNPVFGAYPAHNPVTGIRRQSYEGYTYTYEDLGNGSYGYEVHDDGEIWAAALWDLRKSLGQTVTDLLVTNGLKGTPCNPSMTEARDAILAADQAANQGANRALIWQVFAKHGIGYSAIGVDGSAMTGSRYDAAYDLPPDLQTGANPAITSDPLGVSTDAGSNYSYTVAATNPNGGTLNFKLIDGPSGMHIDSATGAITWTASFTNQRVKISVADGKGGSVIHGFDLPVFTHLTTGSPLIIGGDAYSSGFASFNLPDGVPLLQVTLRGAGGGDADILVTQPDGRTDFSANDGNNETLSIVSPAAGQWQILVAGYKWYSGVTLEAAAVTPQPLNIRASLTGLTAVQTSESSYKITIPVGATSFSVTASSGTGDVDLYLRKDLPAVCQPFNYVSTECQTDQRSESAGNSEFIALTNPAPGDWYLDLSAYEGYSGVNLSTAIAGPPTLIIDQAALPFTAQEGGQAPPAQAIGLTNLAIGPYAWTAQVATAAGGDWLAIDKNSGEADASLSVSVEPAGLKAGVYNGTITLAAPGLANSPVAIAVTLTLTAAPVVPVIEPNGVLNGASFQPVISAGSWVSILGSNLSTQTGDWGGAITNGVLPVQLDGVSVSIGGLPAYVNYVSPTQINIQAPDVPEGPVQVTVTDPNGTSVPFTAQVERESPAFFLWLGKYAVATHLDYTLAVAPDTFPGAATVAAKPAEVLILWATGLGPTSPPVPAGIQVPGDRVYSTADAIEVTVGGTPAQVYGAALSPGFVGLYQVAIQVPADLTDGDYPVQVKAGTALSPGNVYLSVYR